MIKKGIVAVWVAFLSVFFIVQGSMAAGEIEVMFETTFTSSTPVFMSGHEGDLSWVKGFNFTGDISLGGTNIGTASGQISFSNPPMNLAMDRYSHGITEAEYSLPGIGTFEVTAQMVALSSSTSPQAGDVTWSFSGSISNGTGALSDIYGMAAGIGSSNIVTSQGSGNLSILFRFGY